MPSHRILVLDDEPIVCKRLKPALEKVGHSVDVVQSGSDAIARLKEHQYDIVVTDIRMEGLDGLDVLNHVQAHSPHTKVIMITGYATVDTAREALTKGAFDFIAKPFKLNDLREAIARAAAKLEEEAG